MSELELQYIMLKYTALDEKSRYLVFKNIQELIAELKSRETDEPFFYKCPFLLDGSCSVYENRAIICRTHGLMFFLEDNKGNEKYKIPFCVHLGLNYSNVYDEDLKTITEELCEKSGIEFPPQAYNLSLKRLTEKGITNNLGFEFVEIKPMIEWFL